MNYDDFLDNGFLNLGEIVDKKKCIELYKKIENSRPWGKNLFRNETEVDSKLFPDKTKDNPRGGTNPGRGICNHAEIVDLSFIEENKEFKKTIVDICGPNFEILLKKFVVAVPNDWIPVWLQKKMKNDYFDNLNPYIKEEFRDFTHFRGIDYHMDIMDQLNSKPDIITVYVYLNDVEDGATTNFNHYEIKIKPEIGKTLIWPAEWTHAHTGEVLNSGTKYIITGWMHFSI